MHVIMFSIATILAIVATVFLFVFWLIVAIFRKVSGLFLGPGLKQARPLSQQTAGPDTRPCRRESCQTINPAEARFCRRCGQPMEEAIHRAARPVAIL